MITDTHAHVFWTDFDADRQAVLERARAAEVSRMIIVGTNPDTSAQAFALCEGQTGLHPSAGIHPHDATDHGEDSRELIRELCLRPACVAVGETGLDWFKAFSPREAQVANFRWHLQLACELELPIIVHCRDAHLDTLALLREFSGVRGVMHCFTMGERELAPYLELGFYISFSGVVTYPKNIDNRAAAKVVPRERLLVETDCPFLAPQGQRGKRNEPALVRSVLEHIAHVRGDDFTQLARATSANASLLFGLPDL